MKKYIKFLFFIIYSIFVTFVILPDDIVLDKIEILENKNCIVRIHNIDNPDNVKLKINDKIFNDFTINFKKIKSYFIILIDNSGSMILNDFLEIRDRVVYLLKNLDKENDLIKIYKINDNFELLFPASKYQEKMVERISRLQREGKKSRIFDAINDALTEANQLFIKPEYKDYDFYVMLFSDADDNVNPYVELYKNSYVPFFYFSYFSKAEQFKTEKVKTLAKETKGNTLHKPTYEDINNLFFNKQKRYEVTLNIPLNKNEIVKSKEYFLTILEGEKKLVIDIKKYFQLSEKSSERSLEKSSKKSNQKLESSQEKSTEKQSENLANNSSQNNSLQNEKSQKDVSEKLQNQKSSQKLSDEMKGSNENNQSDNEKIKEKELIENITNIDSKNNQDINNQKNKDILNYFFSIDFIKDNILYIVIIFIVLLILITLLLLKKIIFAKTEKADYSNNSSKKSTFSDSMVTNSFNETEKKEKSTKSDKKIEQQKTENKKQEEKTEKKEENKQENKTEEKKQQQKNENEQDKQKKTEDVKKLEEIKKAEKEKAINELIKKDFVKIKYIKDHLAHNKVSKFQLIYNRSANFIDEEEHSGEQILIESKLEIKNVEEKALTVKSDIPLLIENTIKLKEINFIIKSIEYDIETQDYTYYLVSNDDKDILHLFSTKDTVLGERTLDLFGKATALVEKSISKNIEKERIKLNSVFETKIFKESESVFIELNYDIPVDTELEITNEETGNKVILNVKKVVFKNGKYKIYLS